MRFRNDQLIWIGGWTIVSGVFCASVSQAFDVRFWPPFLIMSSLGVASFIALSYYSERRAGFGKLNQMVQDINDIPLSQARNNAIAVLNDPSLFRATSNGISVNISELGPLTQELFLNYDYIESLMSGFYLDGNAIMESTLLDHSLVIGKPSDTEELVVHPGEDEVLLLDGERDIGDRIIARFQSIYHCVLFES